MSSYKIIEETINGYHIELAEVGEKTRPVLVFMHGLGGNLRQWDRQLEYFGRDYYVIAFSLQGHGDSEKPEMDEAYTIEEYGDVAIKLLEIKQVSSCIWVGNSMGGVIGYEVMRREQDLINHLITNGTTPKLQYGQGTLKAMLVMDKFLIGILGYERYINIAVKATLKDVDKRKILKEIFMQAYPKAIISSHQILGNYDYLNLLKKTKIKVSFMLTPGDKGINKEINKYRNELEKRENLRFFQQEKGGQVFNLEMPNEYNRVLEEILLMDFVD